MGFTSLLIHTNAVLLTDMFKIRCRSATYLVVELNKSFKLSGNRNQNYVSAGKSRTAVAHVTNLGYQCFV